MENIDTFLIVAGIILLAFAFILIGISFVSTPSPKGGLSLEGDHNEFMDELFEHYERKGLGPNRERNSYK